MISQRYRGLNQTLFICQLLMVMATFGMAMAVSFAYFTAATRLHLEHYPLYAIVLMGGLSLESLTRGEGRGSYNLLTLNFLSQSRITLRQTVFCGGALLLYLVANKDEFISRTVLGVFLPLLYLILFWTNRRLPVLLARRAFGGSRRDRVLLIGSASKAKKLRQWLCHKAPLGLEAVGLVSDDDAADSGFNRLGGIEDIERILTEQQVNDAIVLGLPEDPARHERLVDLLEDHGVRIVILSDLEEKLKHRAVHIEDDGLSFVTTRQEPLENPMNLLIKRILDLSIAIPVVLFLLPPATLVTWILQRKQSPGPIFYRQRRAGFQNNQFEIRKFRTMYAVDHDFTRQAFEGDSRIYPAARWLRRFSIDELPQFVNVLRGEMSVVGPRPHLVEHNIQFAQQMKKYHIRAFVRPGITGLAQLRGYRGEIRSADDIRARLESDISYLEEWRLTTDILIIFQTALQIFFMLVNSLLQKKKRVVAARRKEAGYRRGEKLGGEVESTYESYAFRRNFRQILGIRFFTGNAMEAVELAMKGGLIVAPSAPVLIALAESPVERAAVASSDLAITDSGLMVLLWRIITGERITRVSGLEFINILLKQPEVRKPGATFWVMPNVPSMERNLKWLQSQGFSITEDDCYVAPNYQNQIDEIIDIDQMNAIRRKRPAHIIMTIGGGVQERLGAELRRNLDYRPSIYCLGAAIGFLSGDQVRIPMWADQCRLGWLFRCFSQPAKFLPRYWEARKLLGLMLEYQGRLPVVAVPAAAEAQPRDLTSRPAHATPAPVHAATR